MHPGPFAMEYLTKDAGKRATEALTTLNKYQPLLEELVGAAVALSHNRKLFGHVCEDTNEVVKKVDTLLSSGWEGDGPDGPAV